ncbi:MAG: DUF3047 domain-containing protein [Nitrospiraceae bacterium]
MSLFRATASFGEMPEVLQVGAFSAASLGDARPVGWDPLTFSKIPAHTMYAVVEDDRTHVVHAVAKVSAGGLIARRTIDLREYPIVEWRWKVGNLLAKGDVTKKSGDDYPARLYITFEYDAARASFVDAAKFKLAKTLFGADVPFRALNYIWDTRAAVGRIVPSAYTDWSMMVVVESGAEHVGQWRTASRNVAEDFRRAFGEEPPLVSGVAIMTDTDNTGESAEAWYGDIVFRRQPR